MKSWTSDKSLKLFWCGVGSVHLGMLGYILKGKNIVALDRTITNNDFYFFDNIFRTVKDHLQV